MKNRIVLTLLVILPFLGNISCMKKEHKGDSIKNVIVELESSIEKDDVFIPDITVNNLLNLRDRESSRQFYPNMSSLKLIELVRESPVFAFDNKYEEYLLLYTYEGGVDGEFDCVEIGYLSNLEDIVTIKTAYDRFQTESDIKLGLTFEELIEIKGDSYIKEGNKVVYREDDYINSDFLKKYNMPSYFLECTLENGRIEKIKYGFDYP